VVIVPDEVAFKLHDLELIVVHLGNDLRLPLLVEQSELSCEIDRLVAHPGYPSVAPRTFRQGHCGKRPIIGNLAPVAQSLGEAP
jgi:hypothetical protein